MSELKQFEADGSLVALSRAGVDDNKIQGFVLGSSDQLVLLQYVYDFNLDGLMILQTSGVSEVAHSKTEEFREQVPGGQQLRKRLPAVL